MIRRLLYLLLAATALPLFASDSRSFEATYIATVKDVPAGLKEMTVWIPLPVSRGGQTITDVRVDSPQRWTETSEGKFGDPYAFATIANPPAGDFAVKVHFRGARNEVTSAKLAETHASQAEPKRARKADKLVTLSPRVKKLANEVTAGKTTPVAQAHAIYDYLLATMKYDKTIPGWGMAIPSAPATSKRATAPISIRCSCPWRAPKGSRRVSSSVFRWPRSTAP